MAHITLNHAKLTLEGADAVLAAAKAHAIQIGVPMNIAIVDEGGHLFAFARMDGAKPSSIAIAINKAHASAIRRQATGPARGAGEVSLLLSLSLAIGSKGEQTPMRGGVPLEANGEIIGAIGVSAGSEDQDVAVALAGAAALGKA